MSELKAFNCVESDLQEFCEPRLVYLKSEADKVIAEKDAKILALDAEVFKQKHHAKLFFDERNYAEAQLRHQKYKRCLALAKIASDNWHIHNSFYAMGKMDFEKKKCERYERHRLKWLAIADKLKEA
jgi:hypothetical protein